MERQTTEKLGVKTIGVDNDVRHSRFSCSLGVSWLGKSEMVYTERERERVLTRVAERTCGRLVHVVSVEEHH